MKKKIVISMLSFVSLLFVSCNSDLNNIKTTSKNDDTVSNTTPTISTSIDIITTDDTDKEEILNYTKAANKKLDDIKEVITSIFSTEQKILDSFLIKYNDMTNYINKVSNLNDAKNLENKIKLDIESFVNDDIKTIFFEQSDKEMAEYVASITDEIFKGYANEKYNSLKNEYISNKYSMRKFDASSFRIDMSYINMKFSSVFSEAKHRYEKMLININSYIQDAKKRLEYIKRIIEDEVKDDSILKNFETIYNNSKNKIEKIKYYNDAYEAYNNVLYDCESFVSETIKQYLLNKGKTNYDDLIKLVKKDSSKEQVEGIYNSIKSKIENQAYDDNYKGIDNLYSHYKDLINSTNSWVYQYVCNDMSDEIHNIVEKNNTDDKHKNSLIYRYGIMIDNEFRYLTNENIFNCETAQNKLIKELEDFINKMKNNSWMDLINEANEIRNKKTIEFIPDSMKPSLSNVVEQSDINYDFNNQTEVSSISGFGYGNEWQNILEGINNIDNLKNIFKEHKSIFDSIDSKMVDYFKNTYDHTKNSGSFEFEYGTVTIKFDSPSIIVEIEFTENIDALNIKDVNPIIKMIYNFPYSASRMVVYCNDSCQFDIIITDNSYEVGAIYDVSVNGEQLSRSSYFSIDNSKDITTGLYREMTMKDNSYVYPNYRKLFEIDEDYVSVLSVSYNGYDQYMNELYSKKDGKLIGYRDITPVSSGEQYTKLWLNLSDIEGIQKVKINDKSDSNPSKDSIYDVYLNDSSELFIPSYNDLKMDKNRKYDIELVNRNYYAHDSINDEYLLNKTNIPMIFIYEAKCYGEETNNLENFEQVIKETNNLDLKINLTESTIDKLLIDSSHFGTAYIPEKHYYEYIISEIKAVLKYL